MLCHCVAANGGIVEFVDKGGQEGDSAWILQENCDKVFGCVSMAAQPRTHYCHVIVVIVVLVVFVSVSSSSPSLISVAPPECSSHVFSARWYSH